jgi:hypothetical protein
MTSCTTFVRHLAIHCTTIPSWEAGPRERSVTYMKDPFALPPVFFFFYIFSTHQHSLTHLTTSDTDSPVSHLVTTCQAKNPPNKPSIAWSEGLLVLDLRAPSLRAPLPLSVPRHDLTITAFPTIGPRVLVPPTMYLAKLPPLKPPLIYSLDGTNPTGSSSSSTLKRTTGDPLSKFTGHPLRLNTSRNNRPGNCNNGVSRGTGNPSTPATARMRQRHQAPAIPTPTLRVMALLRPFLVTTVPFPPILSHSTTQVPAGRPPM